METITGLLRHAASAFHRPGGSPNNVHRFSEAEQGGNGILRRARAHARLLSRSERAALLRRFVPASIPDRLSPIPPHGDTVMRLRSVQSPMGPWSFQKRRRYSRTSGMQCQA
jgi:hypothetical protein